MDRAVIYPRRIVEEAIGRHAASVILVHNHPSGQSEPSPEDRGLTRSIVEASRTIDLRVLDHIIVGKEGNFSFVENHIFPAAARYSQTGLAHPSRVGGEKGYPIHG